jgi:hypothetical protein
LKRTWSFLLLLVASLAALLSLGFWYVAANQRGNSSIEGMMGQMMGNEYAYGMTVPMPSYLWALVVSLVALIVAGIGGVAYYLAFPEIRTNEAPSLSPQTLSEVSGSPRMNWSVLIRTSKPEEKKVLEVIASHEGKYLQKFIVKESGLSRLKTHRIVSRFAERGIVTVSRSGNTNEVSLAPWLKGEASGKGPTT